MTAPSSRLDEESDFWRDSPSPIEEWGEGADDDGNWPVLGIVGEEMTSKGELMYVVAHHAHQCDANCT